MIRNEDDPFDNIHQLFEVVFGRGMRMNELGYRIVDEENFAVILVEIPGMTPTVKVDGSDLIIETSRAEKVDEDVELIHDGLLDERTLKLTIPNEYHTSGIVARDEGNGILKIRVPKRDSEAAKIRTIEIVSPEKK